METETLTYGKKIEELKKLIAQIYDDAEWLRDCATMEEKEHWNEMRRIFYDADKPLRKLLNGMNQNRFDTEL
ncbi:MAG: hypothetical protein MUF58_02575 [Arcicella sp.]|jgi:hypothetical protein|nr:hypothetical protein [Arcicella sp.]